MGLRRFAKRFLLNWEDRALPLSSVRYKCSEVTMIWKKLPKENHKRFKWQGFFWMPLILLASVFIGRWVLNLVFGDQIPIPTSYYVFSFFALYFLCIRVLYTTLKTPLSTLRRKHL